VSNGDNSQPNGILQVFDVTYSTNPVLVGTAVTGPTPTNVYTSGNYAYVVNSGNNSLQIFDVSKFTQ
jgi:hypothetical protein